MNWPDAAGAAPSQRSRDPDNFDFVGAVRSLAETARYHRGIVLATAAVTLALAVLYAHIWPPIYQVEAMVMVENDTDAARDSFYSNWNFFRKDSARTEIELMVSGAVLREVIVREKLRYEDVYHPFMSQLSYFWEVSWPGRAYKSFKAWLFGADEADLLDPATAELGKTLQDMRAGITVEPVGESNVARVRMKGPSRRVADVTNTLLKVYQEKRGERHSGEARQAFDTLTVEAERARADLADVASRRVAFLERNALTFDLQKETQEVKNLSDLESNMIAARMKVANLEGTITQLDKMLTSAAPTVKTSSVTELNSLRETAKLKRLELQANLILTQIRYREDSPEVQELRQGLARLDQLVGETVERVEKGYTEGLNTVHQQLVANRNAAAAELNGTKSSLASMESSAERLRRTLARVPSMQNDLRALDRLYGVASEKYQALLSKRAQVEVSMTTARATTPSLRVVDYAEPPASRWWPRAKILYPAALVLGLALGLVAALVRRLASGRLRRGHWGRRTGDAPVYGVVVVPNDRLPFSVLPRLPAAVSPSPGSGGVAQP